MIAVVLEPFKCRGVDYDRGHILDTAEPSPLHATLEHQLVDQRKIRPALPDEYEAWRSMQDGKPDDAAQRRRKTA